MKKLLLIFLLVLFFFAGCGSSEKNNEPGLNDTDLIEDADIETNDEEHGEPAADGDSVEPQRDDEEPEGPTDDDTERDDTEEPDGTPDEGSDDDEDGDAETPEEDGDAETPDEDSSVTRVVDCEWLPENAEWYGTGTIEQTWDGTGWVPEAVGQYSDSDTGANLCLFKCSGDLVFLYHENKCIVDPCVEANPCSALANSTGECTFNGYDNTYACECKPEALWNGDDCFSRTIGGRTWSAQTEHKKWAEAKTYCESLEEDGFSDWRLPTVSELRTLVRNCDKTAPGGSCMITDECTKHSDCWSIDCSGCNSAEIKTNVFGDGPYKFFWSSQSDVINNAELVIAMLYYDGSIGYLQPDNNQGYVRCVR